MEWYLKCIRLYAEFNGRARRKEYWMFILINLIFVVVAAFIDAILGSVGILTFLYSIFIFLPSLAVTVRRLHDTGRSGWWLLIGLVPLIGIFVLLFYMVQDGDNFDNDFGPNPKELELLE